MISYNRIVGRHEIGRRDGRWMMMDAQAAITDAVRSARYNEAVVVTVKNDDDDDVDYDGSSSSSSTPVEIVLVACLDEENGGIVWRPVATTTKTNTAAAAAAANDVGNDFDVLPSLIMEEDDGIVRHLRTKTWALPMLNDRRRNRMYDVAIREACKVAVGRRIAAGSSSSVGCDDGGGTTTTTTTTTKKTKTKTIRILDIGSGTGLLAMMGARHALDAAYGLDADGARVRVTSVEMASAMARLARMTIDENGLSDHVEVIERHSTDTDFVIHDDDDDDENERADACTSELLDSGLLGEGVLPSIRDAWIRHLRPDAIVVPRRARVYAVPVEGASAIDGASSSSSSSWGRSGASVVVNAVSAFAGPDPRAFRLASGGVRPSTDADAVQYDGGVLLGAPGGRDDSTGGGTVVGGITVPLHADAMLDEGYRDPSANLTSYGGAGDFRGIRPLAEPAMVLDFDFASGADALPPPTGRSTITRISPTADGVCHGILFWWELDLCDSCTYSTKPMRYTSGICGEKSKDGSELLWQDHWQQCLYVFGDGHSENNAMGSRRLMRGSPMKIIASHDDSSISFSIDMETSAYCAVEVQNDEDGDSRPVQRRKMDEHNETGCPPLNHHISTTRALQLNDASRTRTLTVSIQYCIESKGRDAPLLDLSDFGLCAMIASVLGARNVTSLESSSGNLPTVAATVAQVGNGLPRAGAEFRIIHGLAEHISVENMFGCAAEIVVAEPYYEMLEGWHLQEALNYFYTVRSLKKRGVISPAALSVPAYANVMACVVEFDEFFSAYGKVGDGSGLVSGLRHSSVNYYGDRYHTYDVSLPMWQYRYRRISESCSVARISYEGDAPTIETGADCAAELISAGIAHAVVFWVDYACRVVDESGGVGNHFAMISTASYSHRQLVRQLSEPFAFTDDHVAAGANVYCKASFGVDPDGIEDHTFTFEVHLQ